MVVIVVVVVPAAGFNKGLSCTIYCRVDSGLSYLISEDNRNIWVLKGILL